MEATEREQLIARLVDRGLRDAEKLPGQLVEKLRGESPEVFEDVGEARVTAILTTFAGTVTGSSRAVLAESYGTLTDEQLRALVVFYDANPWFAEFTTAQSRRVGEAIQPAMGQAFGALLAAAEEAIEAKEIEAAEDATAVPASERTLS